MTKHIGTLNELGCCGLDCQLYLAKIFVHVYDVDKDIVGA